MENNNNIKRTFALNRIMSPVLSVSEFINLASECSAMGIELRNDLADPSLLGGEKAEVLKALSEEKDVEILTVNALQRFNDPVLFDEKKTELLTLMEEAASVGCRQIVLCPVNDADDKRSSDVRHTDLVAALKIYAPLFQKYGMTGLVEPLGFEICSVRTKKQAVAAIKESGHSAVYKLVHDTFHHYLSGEKDFFPAYTGLVHVSGVHAGKEEADITDDDRLFVDAEDILDNKGQVERLKHTGCKGDFSFETFSPAVQKLEVSELKQQIENSVQFLFT